MNLDTLRRVNIIVSGRRLALDLYKLWQEGKIQEAEQKRIAASENYKQMEEQESSKKYEWFMPTLSALENIPDSQQIRITAEITAAKADLDVIILSSQESSEDAALLFEQFQEKLRSILRELELAANTSGTSIPSYGHALVEMAPVQRNYI